MIAYVMLYTIAVGVPVLAAAWALAHVLRAHGRAERWVWLGALLLAFALPLTGLVRSIGAGTSDAASGLGGPGTGVIGLPEIVVVPVPGGLTEVALPQALIALWLATSILLAGRLLLAALRLGRASRSWRPGTMDGTPVWLTDEVGPAVAGLLRPRILVPTWLAEMPTRQRSLVLLHEQEHIRAGDSWLMLLSRLAPLFVPWNPVVWAMSHRLLRAIELDCDRRVLRRRPDVRTYGTTLIEISRRDRGRLVAVAAFAESEAPLRSRILSMTTPSRAVSVAALLVSLVFGVLLITAAFEIPVPTLRAQLTFGPEAAQPTDAERSAVVAPVVENVEGQPDPARAVAEAVIARRRPEAAADELARATAETDARRRADELARATREWEARLGGSRTPDLKQYPQFTPFTVAPALLNVAEVQRVLTREYPTVVRDSGIGGTVQVWFYIDEDGQVERTLLNQSSGYPALDEAAMSVADVYRFSPAKNRDQRIPVWVSLPITFRVR